MGPDGTVVIDPATASGMVQHAGEVRLPPAAELPSLVFGRPGGQRAAARSGGIRASPSASIRPDPAAASTSARPSAGTFVGSPRALGPGR